MFKIRPKKVNKPTLVIQIFFVVFALLIIGQLFKLQILDLDHLKEKSRNMRAARSFVFRGEIFDRNGVRLASDTTLYDVYAHPQYYNFTPKEMAVELSPLLKMPVNELEKKLNRLNSSTITIKKNIDRDTAKKINKLKIRGLDLAQKTQRTYPQGNLASHILGYVNFDADISAGVEHIASKDLETLSKPTYVGQNGLGEIVYDFDTDPEYVAKPLRGGKVTLTINSEVQHIAEKELFKMVQKTRADKGTVIVMNPKNGEILGFAVYPSYNPNEYKKVKPDVIKNWVLSDVYPPGSTFKILTIASALDTGRLTEDEKILDTGQIKIQGWTIKNYDCAVHPHPGLIDLGYLFEHSSNVGSLKVALKMTPQEHYEKLKQFGIGSRTGIDLPGESRGILPEPNTWDKVRQATIGFGYSIASTPIQVLSGVSAIANKGVWVTPHVIKYTGEEYKAKIKTHRVISEATSASMTRLLEKSIQRSKSSAGKIPNFTVAGKTGTSRKPNPNGPGYLEGQVYTSFAGYFPASDPQVVMMVVVDNPKGFDIWGSTVAGPVFNEVATQITRVLKLKPDAPGLNVKNRLN